MIATSPQACKEIEKYFHKKTHLISEFETDEIKRIMNKNVKPFALNILKSSYNERYNIKKFLKTLKYTLFYYVKGKQKKYTSPVRYNAKRLYNTFWETLAYYALKMRK